MTAEPSWPVVIFEADGWPVIIRAPESLVDLFEDEFWDEARLAFDSEFWRVEVILSERRNPALRRVGEASQRTRFRKHAIHALLAFDRKTAFHWHPAGAERAEQIDVWEPEMLRLEVIAHFTDK